MSNFENIFIDKTKLKFMFNSENKYWLVVNYNNCDKKDLAYCKIEAIMFGFS